MSVSFSLQDLFTKYNSKNDHMEYKFRNEDVPGCQCCLLCECLVKCWASLKTGLADCCVWYMCARMEQYKDMDSIIRMDFWI